MEAVFARWLDADVRLPHLLILLFLLHQLVALALRRHHLVAMVAHQLLRGLSGRERTVSLLVLLPVHQHVLLQDGLLQLLVTDGRRVLPLVDVVRGGAELDVALEDEAHGLLHVATGDAQRAARLRQPALGEHLQQVALLVVPLRQQTLQRTRRRRRKECPDRRRSIHQARNDHGAYGD